MRLTSQDVIDVANSTDASALIEYFELQNKKQKKRDYINLIIDIISVVASIGAFITSIIAIIK